MEIINEELRRNFFNKGITLIALVITIIVLLILAGITIATLTGDNGILNQANKAKETTEIGEEKEIIGLSVIQATNNNGTIYEDELQKALNENSKEGNKASIIASDIETFTVKFESNRYYEVNKGGSIEYIENVTGEKILTVQCVNSKNELLKEYRYTIVTDDYSKTPPIIEGYEAQNERIIGKITEDTTIKILYYYLIQEDELVFTGLDDTGKIISDNSKIASYMIGSSSSVNTNGLNASDSNKALTLESILYIPEIYNNKPVTKIQNYAFFGNIFLKKVTVCNSITTIGDHVFKKCSNLEEVTIGKGVNFIGAWTFEATPLKKVVYNNETNAIVSSEQIFSGSLEKIEINEDNNKFNVIDGILYSKDGSTIVKVPAKVEGDFKIPDEVTTIGQFAFEFVKFDNIIMSDNVTKLNKWAFNCCRAKTVTLSKNLKVIESSAFERATVTSMIIPENIVTIADHAFKNCSSLEIITIGSGVASIGNFAFEGTVKLKTIVIDSNIISNSLSGTTPNISGGLLYYPQTIYIKEENDVSSYITLNYTLEESDKEVYIKYVKNT